MEDLKYQEPFIALEIENDGEGNSLCSIILDDEQTLTITAHELINLYKIITKNKEEITTYFNKTLEPFMEDTKYSWE